MDLDTLKSAIIGSGGITIQFLDMLPEIVSYTLEDEPESVQYRLISVLLLEEMKKLKARIEVLEGN